MSKVEINNDLTSLEREFIHGIAVGVFAFTKQLDLQPHHATSCMIPLIYHYFPNANTGEIKEIMGGALDLLMVTESDNHKYSH